MMNIIDPYHAFAVCTTLRAVVLCRNCATFATTRRASALRPTLAGVAALAAGGALRAGQCFLDFLISRIHSCTPLGSNGQRRN